MKKIEIITEWHHCNGPASVAEWVTDNPYAKIVAVNNDDAGNWYIFYQETDTELILRGIEEGAEQWKMDAENWQHKFEVTYAALHELVSLKRIKETQGETLDYVTRKPLAWKKAMLIVDEVVNSHTGTTKSTNK
jgi:hypothetical protein